MHDSNIKTFKGRSSQRDFLTESDNSTSPELRIKGFSDSTNHLLGSVSCNSMLSKLRLKQELSSLKTLPNQEYKSRLQSFISTVSNSQIPLSGNFSPRGLDSIPSFPEKDTCQVNTKNVHLKPLNSLINYISRAGYKIHNGTSSSTKKYHQVGIAIKPSFQNTKGTYLFSLFEGYGPEGYKLVRCLKLNIVSLLERHMHLDVNMVSSSLAKIDELYLTSLKDSRINLGFSGCSLINILVYGDTVFVSNIGSSQAVMGKFSEKWGFKAINKPHNLKNLSERKRILEFGGKISELGNSKNSELLVEKFDESGCKSPRFEETRVIGHLTGIPIGICSKPDNIKFQFKAEDKFIIIGNSALWRVIGPGEAVQMVVDGWENKKTDLCCDVLIKEAENRNQMIFNENPDISVIVLFVN